MVAVGPQQRDGPQLLLMGDGLQVLLRQVHGVVDEIGVGDLAQATDFSLVEPRRELAEVHEAGPLCVRLDPQPAAAGAPVVDDRGGVDVEEEPERPLARRP